jgi:orotidine-5'-phosphate decarboxylase
MAKFFDMVRARWKKGLFLCVGLDSDFDKLPQSVKTSGSPDPQRIFNEKIIEATGGLVCCFKINMAFYESRGYAGWLALRDTIAFIHELFPDVGVILDFKRGDIGNTNLGYVGEAFGFFKADAVTIHPYLGREAMQPFLDYEDKAIFILCKTSNPGAGEFQDLTITVTDEAFNEIAQAQPGDSDSFFMPKSMPLYQYVAHRVRYWNRKNKNCALVVGATFSQDLAEVRKIAGDMPILIPGIGAQGGDLEASVAAGKDSKGQGMIFNSSREVIFASSGPDFADVAQVRAIHTSTKIYTALQKALEIT